MSEPTHRPLTLEEFIRTQFVWKPFKPTTYQERSGDPDRKTESVVAQKSEGSTKECWTGFNVDILTLNHIQAQNKMIGFRLHYVRSSHHNEKYLPKLLLVTFAHVFIRHAIWNNKALACLKVYAKCFWFSLRHPWVIQKD